MSHCERLWEIEARRDGRLGPDESARLTRHIATCSACAHEQRTLEELTEALNALPDPYVDELTLRRRRAALLARVYEHSVAPRRFTMRWPALALVAASACAAFAWRQTRVQMQATDAQASALSNTPDVFITASAGAQYTREAGQRGMSVRLTHGQITLDVRGSADHAAVVVRTPDGEVVDQGTVFSVAVEHDQTRSVAVTTGSVMVRIRGLPPRSLHAGERYAPYEKPYEPADSSATPATPVTENVASPPRAAVALATKSVKTARSPAASAPASSASRALADVEFESALAALQHDRLAESADFFARFMDAHPDDPRAEDAAFLRIVALTRSHQTSASVRAGERYLSLFPKGLRAREVERMVRPR